MLLNGCLRRELDSIILIIIVQLRKSLNVQAFPAWLPDQSIDLISQTEGIKNEDELNYIHRHKTADLLIASVIAGALCANPTDIQLKTLEGYAEKIGILFQITDDILDAEGDETLVGKTLHKDETDKKLTYVSLYGVERSKNMAQQIAQEAERLLFTTFGENCKYLYDVIYYILNRNK